MLTIDYELIQEELPDRDHRLRVFIERLDALRRMHDLCIAHDLTSRFSPFAPSRTSNIAPVVDDITQCLDQLKRRQKPSPFPLVEKEHRESADVAAIGTLSGCLDRQERIHIHDACGGRGKLAHLVSYLRRDSGPTSSECWEMRTDQKPNFELLKRRSFRKTSRSANFRLGDIRDADLRNKNGVPSFVVAKHACGPSTDYICSNVSALDPKEAPQRSIIMTCCHGKSPVCYPFKRGDAIQPQYDDWETLRLTSQCTAPKNSRWTQLGRAAMRVMDVLRIGNLPDYLDARVTELLPEEQSDKNHAIVLEPRI